MTRILIRDLPGLVAKHQSDAKRMADVLSIPLLMNLDMYLDLRLVPVRSACTSPVYDRLDR